jgi:hypothetical protein
MHHHDAVPGRQRRDRLMATLAFLRWTSVVIGAERHSSA